MVLDEWTTGVVELLTSLSRSQAATLDAVADRMVTAIAEGHSIFAFGCSHSGLLVQEIYYRAGGLAVINPLFGPGMDLVTDPPLLTSDMEKTPGLARLILDHSPLTSGDLLIVVSTSGRNAVPVEMAEEGRRRGATIVALTSLAYSQSVDSRAPSGRRLFEVADFVLDNGAPPGDALLTLPGVPMPVAPVSTITGAFLLQALVALVAERLGARGLPVPVFQSGNLDAGRRHNEAVLSRHRHQIHYPLR
jgi:uncharacterized phosphosugar-binding protein